MQKLETFSSNPGKLHFGGLVHILRYIRENMNLGLNYYADMNDALVSDLLRKASIKNENKLMNFSDSSWQYFKYTIRSKGSYIILYQGEPIDHDTHVPGTVAQSISESEYNAECTLGMTLAHLRILIHEFLNKDTDTVPEEARTIILNSKSSVYMAKNGKDTKHTRHMESRVHLVRNV